MMTVFFDQWYLLKDPSQSLDPDTLMEVDTTPTPDTVLAFWSALGQHVVFFSIFGGFTSWISGLQKYFTFHWEVDPDTLMEVDTTPTPDTVLAFWSALGQADIPFYPMDVTKGSKVDTFAGDMGAYIG